MSVNNKRKAVALLSGGLDSTTSLYWARACGYDVVKAVGFNYGQLHKKELESAQKIADKNGIPFVLIDLWKSGVTEALSNSESSLISGDSANIPEGHYAASNMASTVVPLRNLMMASIASAIAEADGADVMVIGVHAGDHFVYPDCRPDFVRALDLAVSQGTEGKVSVIAPFLHYSKAIIAETAIELGVPIALTWSCYKGGENHCGRCGTCVERAEAINEAAERLGLSDFADPTHYDDATYWRTAIKNQED